LCDQQEGGDCNDDAPLPSPLMFAHPPTFLIKKSVFKARFGKVAIQEIMIDCFLNLYKGVSNIIAMSLN
jgi:hypothetical protein